MAKTKILVIDDEDHILMMIKNRLESSGYAVLTADTGQKGIDIAKTTRPDLILLDVMLPDFNGRVVCRVLKEDKGTAGIPIIFLTAKDSIIDKMAEYEVGGECHVSKPFDAQDLLEKIKRTIEDFKNFEKNRNPSDAP
jgi:DNA-binding response OmpR family regulator